MEKIKVLYLTTQTSPYMINYFNLLAQSVDLTVIFEQKNSDLQQTRWNKFEFNHFKGHVLNGLSLGKYGAISINIIKYINNKYDYIFVTNPLTPSGILSILFMRLKKINYIIESEGGFPGTGKGLKEYIKKQILTNAYYYFSGNATGDKYLILYGADKNKIIRYPFSSIFEKDIIKKVRSVEEKEAYRLQHNLQGKRTAVGIGRLVQSKNWEWLIDEWKSMKTDFHLYIIGEGPLKGHLSNKIASLEKKNVHLLDYMDHNILLDYITNFDVLVHPTLSDVWGLTINEGMARGLPIVSSDKCLGALEMIKQGINGYLFKTNESIHTYVNNLLMDDSKIREISISNLKKVRRYTIDSMVTAHVKFFANL